MMRIKVNYVENGHFEIVEVPLEHRFEDLRNHFNSVAQPVESVEILSVKR